MNVYFCPELSTSMLIFVFNRLIGGAIIYCIFEIAATVKAKDYYAATESVVSFLLSA